MYYWLSTKIKYYIIYNKFLFLRNIVVNFVNFQEQNLTTIIISPIGNYVLFNKVTIIVYIFDILMFLREKLMTYELWLHQDSGAYNNPYIMLMHVISSFKI